MLFSQADKAAQAALSSHAARWLEFVERHPEALDRGGYQGFYAAAHRALPRILGMENQRNRFGLQPWPVLLSAARVQEFERAAVGLARLCRSLPWRLFGGDAARVREFYGLPSTMLAALLVSEPTGAEITLARGDFLDTDRGLACIEMNFGNLGGWQHCAFEPAFRDQPLLAAFLTEEGVGLTCTSSIRRLLHHVVADHRRTEAAPPADGRLGVLVIASDAGTASLDSHPRDLYQRELDRVLAEDGSGLGGTVVVAKAAEVSYAGGGVSVWGRRFQAVIEQGEDDTPRPLFRAFKSGGIRLYSGPVGMILGDKRNLALLSEHCGSDQRDSPLFSDDERALIRDYVPWTRRVVPGAVDLGGELGDDLGGERLAMADLLGHHRERLVLKAGESLGGADVVIGHATDPERWAAAAAAALADGGWVVQEYLEPRAYTFQAGDHGAGRHDLVWGLFAFGDAYGGCFIRMAPRGDTPVLNVSRGATVGLGFEVAEAPAR